MVGDQDDKDGLVCGVRCVIWRVLSVGCGAFVLVFVLVDGLDGC